MIDKAILRDTMLALEKDELAHAVEAYEEYLREATLDRGEIVDLDV
ncbi:MAG: hypothetical protein AAGF94_13710 [Pseudomonadota bacterium]